MPMRTLGPLGLAAAGLLLSISVINAQGAQGPTLVPGTTTPGVSVIPVPRPQTPGAPARDNSAINPTGTARIRGRVVSADTGNPLRRAQVRLSAGEPRVMMVANTDVDGRYEFASLPAGRYSLMASRNGYVGLQFGQQRPFESGKPLELSDGQLADKIDFALPKGGVIVGRITDDSGEPAPGVRVQAMRYQYMPTGQRQLSPGGTTGMFGPTVTDDLGQFRVYGLMPGDYVLSAMPTTNGVMMSTVNGVTSTQSNPADNDGFVTSYYPGTASADEAQPVTVELGREASAFFSLISGRLSRISGTVRNSQGRPVVGAMIMLRTMSGTMSIGSGGGMTGPDGSFNLTSVTPGEHFIDVRPRPDGMPGPPGAAGSSDQEFASIPVSANGTDITGLVITTGTGATINGRVIFEGNSPRTGGQTPLRVMASSPEPGGGMAMAYSIPNNGNVDDGGRFQIKGASGKVLFRPITSPGWFLKSVTVEGVDHTDVPYEIKGNVGGIDVVLTDRQTNISGTVRGPRGEVKDFVVVVFPSYLREDVVPMRFIQMARPNQDGRYVVRNLPPGDYVAAAVESLEQGRQWDPAFQQQVRPRGKTFRLNDGQTMTVDLELIQ